jgi:integrase
LLEEKGLPRRRFHDLRHSCGSLLAAQGVPLHEVQAILGHAQLSTTMIYVHSVPEGIRKAAQQMDDALWGSGPAG